MRGMQLQQRHPSRLDSCQAETTAVRLQGACLLAVNLRRLGKGVPDDRQERLPIWNAFCLRRK